MANHVIRDRIWASRKLAACSLKAALAYPWLFLVADDWGRFEYQPRVIWGQVFGGREDVSIQDVKDWLHEYELVHLLVRYHIDGELAYWTGFHGQRKDKRRPSLYPDPASFSGLSQEVGVLSATITEQNGTDQEQERDQEQTKRKRARVDPDSPEARSIIDAYNRILASRIGYTTANLAAAHRALEQDASAEDVCLQAVRIFEAVRDRSTKTAKWCAENNASFEYLIRPQYRKAGELIPGPWDKIPNELDGPVIPEPSQLAMVPAAPKDLRRQAAMVRGVMGGLKGDGTFGG